MQKIESTAKTQPGAVPAMALWGSEVARIRSIQTARGKEPCFMTDKRLLCKREECEWRNECRRLLAAWKR